MTEPVKPKHAGRRAAARPSRLAWARTTGGQVGIGVGVLALAFVLRFAVAGGDDDHDGDNQTPVGAGLTTYGADWKTKDGSSYRITVTPIAELVGAGSASGCVPVAGRGRTNLRFTVRIDNRGSDPAPVPEVLFGANLTKAGGPSSSLSFAKASKVVDVGPQTGVRNCVDAARISVGDQQIGAKSAVTYTGLVGGVKAPVGRGVSLIVRYTQADAGAADGTGTADVVVRFPDLSELS
jgi:hypothetical protein